MELGEVHKGSVICCCCTTDTGEEDPESSMDSRADDEYRADFQSLRNLFRAFMAVHSRRVVPH